MNNEDKTILIVFLLWILCAISVLLGVASAVVTVSSFLEDSRTAKPYDVKFISLVSGIPLYIAKCGVPNAIYTGSEIVVCDELGAYIDSQDQFSMVVYHEVGHAILRHLDSSTDSIEPKQKERDADDISFTILKGQQATVGVCDLFLKMPQFDDTDATHPSSEKRWARCVEVVGGLV